MSNEQPDINGIGIIKFLKHKIFFITGSTGFIAKVFVEKLLREVPEVEKVYLLIRAKNTEAAKQRLKNEVIDCEVFKWLKDIHGERYEEFMRSKLVAVAGDICGHNLGMDADYARDVAQQVNVIINIAGNTKWRDRYDAILNVNVRGLSRLLGYAMDCKKLNLFLHVSTAYVVQKTEDFILKPTVFKEEITLNIDAELKMVAKVAARTPREELPTEMAKLGMRRAKTFGWRNTYLFTKAMGEMLITKVKDNIPIVIIRPTFIESCYKEPLPGWIEGYRGMDPMILSYGKGQLRGIYADPTSILDIVPMDRIVNFMIAATSNHGIIGKPGIHIYNISSSMDNPLLSQDLFKFSCKYFTMHPIKNSRGVVVRIKDMEFFPLIDEYIMVGLDTTEPLNDKIRNNLVRMAATYWPAMFAKARFNNESTQILWEKLSSEEKKIFNFDVKSIDWEDYFINIHFPGLRKHILKDNFLSPKL